MTCRPVLYATVQLIAFGIAFIAKHGAEGASPQTLTNADTPLVTDHLRGADFVRTCRAQSAVRMVSASRATIHEVATRYQVDERLDRCRKLLRLDPGYGSTEPELVPGCWGYADVFHVLEPGVAHLLQVLIDRQRSRHTPGE